MQYDVVDEAVGQIHEMEGEGNAAVAAAHPQSVYSPSDDQPAVSVACLAGPVFEPLGQEFFGGLFQMAVYFAGDAFLHDGGMRVGVLWYPNVHMAGHFPAAYARVGSARYFDGEGAGGDNVARA